MSAAAGKWGGGLIQKKAGVFLVRAEVWGGPIRMYIRM